MIITKYMVVVCVQFCMDNVKSLCSSWHHRSDVMADVIVLHAEDSKDWKDYLVQRLSSVKDLLSTDSCQLQSVWSLNDDCKKKLTEAKSVVIIASPESLEYLIQRPDCNFSFLEQYSERCMLLLLGVTAEDVENPEHRLRDHFPHYEQWQKVGHESVDVILGTILDTVERSAPVLPAKAPSPPPTGPKPAQKVNRDLPTPARRKLVPNGEEKRPENFTSMPGQTKNPGTTPIQTKKPGITPVQTKKPGTTPIQTRNPGITPTQPSAAAPRVGKPPKEGANCHFELYPTEIRCEVCC